MLLNMQRMDQNTSSEDSSCFPLDLLAPNKTKHKPATTMTTKITITTYNHLFFW